MNNGESASAVSASSSENSVPLALAVANENNPDSIIPLYQNCLEFIGPGSFQSHLLILCGLINSSDAIEILSVSFLLPFVSNSFEFSNSDKGILASSIFAGMIFGSIFIGILGDKVSRKWILFISLMINSMGGFLSSFSNSFFSLSLFRLIAGIGVGGSIPVLFTYFIEFLPLAIRGSYMIYIAWYWMIGAVFTSALAWIVLRETTLTMGNSDVDSWRLFTAICALPSFIGALALLFFPESPRFLIANSNAGGAAKILRDIAQQNRKSRLEKLRNPKNGRVNSLMARLGNSLTSIGRVSQYERVIEPAASNNFTDSPIQNSSDSAVPLRTDGFELDSSPSSSSSLDSSSAAFELEYQNIQAILHQFVNSQKIINYENNSNGEHSTHTHTHTYNTLSPLHSNSNSSIIQSIRTNFTNSLSTIMPLISPSIMIPGVARFTSLRLSIVWFALAFGFYGFTLWLPQFLANENSNNQNNKNTTNDKEFTMDSHIFFTSLLSSLSNFPGNLFSTWSVERIGRIRTLLWSMNGSAVILGILPLAISSLSPDSYVITILIGIFSAVSTAGWNSLNLITTELFPSALRSTAYGLFASAGRIGAIVGTIGFGELIGVNAAIPVLVTALALIIGGLAARNLQETKGKLLL